MPVHGIDAQWRPQLEQPEPQGCFDVIAEIVKKVVNAVAAFFVAIGEFFTTAFNFIFCIPEENPEELHAQEPIPNQWDHIEVADPPEPVNQPDLPVNLEELKAVLRNGHGHPHISRQMTPADFSTLCEEYPIRVTFRKRIGENRWREPIYGPNLREVVVQETQMAQPTFEAVKQEVLEREGAAQADLVELSVDFPAERRQIAEWACTWAAARRPKVDPDHPYFPIIQAAFQHRLRIDGGAFSSADYRTYSPPNQNYYADTNRFTYTVYALIGFQELSRPENIALFNRLDNWSLVNGQNPAYLFASQASRIYTYPKAWGGNVDVRQKLQNGLGAAWAAYESARERNEMLQFFNSCFTNENCFDARVMRFQERNLQNMHPNFDDFNAAVVHTDTVDTKVTRYFGAFKHEQIARYVREHPMARLTYEEMKGLVNRVPNNRHVRAFEAEYCTVERFRAYLVENNQPIREMTIAPAVLPRVPGVAFRPEAAFISVDQINLIPAAQRVAGTWIALQDPMVGNWYKVRVHRVEDTRINLDLRGDPITEARWTDLLRIYGLI